MQQPSKLVISSILNKIYNKFFKSKTRVAYESYRQRLSKGQTEAQAANNTGLEMTQAAELHVRAFVALNFMQQIIGESRNQRSMSLNRLLENILELYLVYTVLRHLKDVLLVGLFLYILAIYLNYVSSCSSFS